MLSLKEDSLKDITNWEALDIKIPKFNRSTMKQATLEHPTWIHFGAGNIFRGFIAKLQQQLLEEGKVSEGIVAIESFDYDIIDKIYRPFDNLTLLALMHPDGRLDKEIIGSVGKALKADVTQQEDYELLKTLFRKPSLQMVSFTITEKGYVLQDVHGNHLPVIEKDLKEGPIAPIHVMSFISSLLYERYKVGAMPIALVSMDNCSHNGEKLQNSVLTIAKAWLSNGFVEQGFIDYLSDAQRVAFPWSMIDKITPRPSHTVQKELEKQGLLDMTPIVTNRNTFIAPFVNAEAPQYLVVEDCFPNGRPPLEDAGVYLTSREVVNQTETMKVTTCLNPLHTALAVYGCLLGYTSIAEEMKDPQLKELVSRIGYQEGMPVVVDPKILSPKNFIDEVIEKRLPNPYIPDMPQRIATDTSQKVGIRFGETIKAYNKRKDLDSSKLTYIPLALAGWLRYLLGVDDRGNSFERSSDPMLEILTNMLEGITLGQPSSYTGQLKPILENETLFGINLYEVGLGDKVEQFFLKLISGEGAVRHTLQELLA